MLLVEASVGWLKELHKLSPGEFVAILDRGTDRAIEARRAGLEMVDTLLVLGLEVPLFAFIMRKIMSLEYTGDELNLVENVLYNKVGGLNVGGTRLDDGRWTPNVAFVHTQDCVQKGEVWGCSSRCPLEQL